MITLLLLGRATYMCGVVLHAHPVRGESHLKQHHRRGCNNIPSFLQQTNRTFFVWRLTLARPSHPSHSTILLRSEIPSGMCAKLRTVAASNNRVHMPWSFYYCLFAPRVCMVLFFTHIPFVVNHTINATPPERLQHYYSTWPNTQIQNSIILLTISICFGCADLLKIAKVVSTFFVFKGMFLEKVMQSKFILCCLHFSKAE